MRNVRSEGKKTGMQVARNPRRRSPHVAAHADFRQGSRLTVAEARSRRCEAIAMRNAAERETIQNSQFKIHNAQLTKNDNAVIPY
jgi:hypothetical protein